MFLDEFEDGETETWKEVNECNKQQQPILDQTHNSIQSECNSSIQTTEEDSNTDLENEEPTNSITIADTTLEDETDTGCLSPDSSAISTKVSDLRNQETTLHADELADLTVRQDMTQTSPESGAVPHEEQQLPDVSETEVEVIYCRQCAVRQQKSRHQSTSTSSLTNRLYTTSSRSVASQLPQDPGETSLKTSIAEASPDSGQFFVDQAMEISQYGQEESTEENSQPAPNSPQSLRPFRSLLYTSCTHYNLPIPNNSNRNQLLVNPRELGVTVVGMQVPVSIPPIQPNAGYTDDTSSDSDTTSEPEDTESGLDANLLQD